jgi:hypothetical protein
MARHLSLVISPRVPRVQRSREALGGTSSIWPISSQKFASLRVYWPRWSKEGSPVAENQAEKGGRKDIMAQGTVKWFSQDKGYGFITPDEGVRIYSFTTRASPGAGLGLWRKATG